MPVASYGSWRSPISAALVAGGDVPLGGVSLFEGGACWLEGRPLEGGRYVVVRRQLDGTTRDLTPPGFNVRTRVHEYGGGAWLVDGSTLVFSNFADQRLYRQDGDESPRPITPEPAVPAGDRFAEARLTPDGQWLICVRERHTDTGSEAKNELAILPADGSQPPRTLVDGHDFFSSIAISPDGRRLAWLAWDHPRMPWDGSDLWVGQLTPDGVTDARRVAGSPEESIYQPGWDREGRLHFVSDRSGWWNLYRLADDDSATNLAPMSAEFGVPQWVFGTSMYAFLDDGRALVHYLQDGFSHLALLDPSSGQLEPLDLPYTAVAPGFSVSGSRVAFVGGTPTEAAAVVVYDLADGTTTVLRRSLEQQVDAAYCSVPQSIQFPTEQGREAYAVYYPPANADNTAPTGEAPPLLVLSHGGPTSATRALFSLPIQFWTSRGFAVVDVNYGGSTGYGRPYRQRLNGQWGIVDVDDCVNAARYLVERGQADGRRLAIRGGSAGGYTTLCALVFRDAFGAGASYYGVADCETLATDTHKFESRYLDSLIGPYPADRDLYYARSPIHFADRLSCPVILFQGLEDRVVPPAQAEQMVQALAQKGVPYAYLAFEGEQHGFRKSSTIQRTLEAELSFYSRVFGFPLPLAEPIEPVPIANLDPPRA
ncbi:MAG: S9 family peptidase [Chloroflexi bacterium]|nr:S9 family peptidase [Chloroflexota bacterium]